jgi:hypothetical protein
MISTVSAVPKVNSDPLMDKIQEFEEIERQINEKLDILKLEVESGGIIDLIIQIIEWLIDIVQQLISVIGRVFQLVELITYLITLIARLYELIMAVIDYILNLFSPSLIRSIN